MNNKPVVEMVKFSEENSSLTYFGSLLMMHVDGKLKYTCDPTSISRLYLSTEYDPSEDGDKEEFYHAGGEAIQLLDGDNKVLLWLLADCDETHELMLWLTWVIADAGGWENEAEYVKKLLDEERGKADEKKPADAESPRLEPKPKEAPKVSDGVLRGKLSSRFLEEIALR